MMDRTSAAFNGFIAAMAMGTARSAYIKAFQYAQERYQFGKMIIEHHEIRRFLANMMAKLNMGTAGYTQALSVDTLESPVLSRASDLAKIFCTDAALEIAIDAIQIHGGYGYTKDYPLERYLRDAKLTEIYEGTSEMMRMTIARQLLRD